MILKYTEKTMLKLFLESCFTRRINCTQNLYIRIYFQQKEFRKQTMFNLFDSRKHRTKCGWETDTEE